MDRNEIVRLSYLYGGAWITGHAERILKLIETIGQGLEYDREVVWMAAYLHDWGACPKWAREGVSHSIRSCEVAGAYLKKSRCPKPRAAAVLDAIRFHHGGSEGRAAETMLLGDADALDSLGVLGVLKEFAMIPARLRGDYALPGAFGLREAYELIRIRRENLPRQLCLETSRAVAATRMADMDRIFSLVERDAFGCL
jgi:uncharacterized protein